MASSRKKRRGKSPNRNAPAALPVETRAAEAVTVCWTVTLTTLFLTGLITLLAHFYVASHPEAQKMAFLGGIMQFAGALIGAISLALLPVVYRVRKVAPPKGLTLFGVCLALAPILVLILKTLP